MPRKPHLFDRLNEEQRLAAMKQVCGAIFGAAKGEAVWQGMEPSLRFKERQLGDAREPAENFWKGTWRIYEAE